MGAGGGASQTAPPLLRAQARGCPAPAPAGAAGSAATAGSADGPAPDFGGCPALRCDSCCTKKALVSGRVKVRPGKRCVFMDVGTVINSKDLVDLWHFIFNRMNEELLMQSHC